MLRILVTAQCDVCFDFFEQLQTCSTANQNECAIQSANIIEMAVSEGWFFNSKTRQFWCVDCMLSLAGHHDMPPVADITVPTCKLA
jgi:hypothetical protein